MHKGKPTHPASVFAVREIVPFLRSIVRSGEEIHDADIDGIEAALKPLLEKEAK